MPAEPADITLTYLRTVTGLLERIHAEEHDSDRPGRRAVAAQIAPTAWCTSSDREVTPTSRRRRCSSARAG